MAKRTLAQMADYIEDLVDKDRADVTFNTFVEDSLNFTLQEIISEVPHARWLLEEISITLVASQQFVVMDSDVDIDAVISMRDNTNNRKTQRITPEDSDHIDPGRDLTGEAILWWFQRVGGADRLYFIHRPDATDSLSLITGEIITDPTSGQTTALPAKYEWIWIAMTMPQIWERLDPAHDISKWERKIARGMARIIKDANRTPGAPNVLASHRPTLNSGIVGPSFPSNFDVLP